MRVPGGVKTFHVDIGLRETGIQVGETLSPVIRPAGKSVIRRMIVDQHELHNASSFTLYFIGDHSEGVRKRELELVVSAFNLAAIF
jgi:hypothetical protein